MTVRPLMPHVRVNLPCLPSHCSRSRFLPSVPLSQPHASTPHGTSVQTSPRPPT